MLEIQSYFVMHDTELTYYSWEDSFDEVIKMPCMLA